MSSCNALGVDEALYEGNPQEEGQALPHVPRAALAFMIAHYGVHMHERGKHFGPAAQKYDT